MGLRLNVQRALSCQRKVADEQVFDVSRFMNTTPLSKLPFEHSSEPALPLNKPAAGVWDTDFGTLLESNEQALLQSWHALKWDSSLSVIAPSNGIVSNLSSEGPYHGLSINHGRGLYTLLIGPYQWQHQVGEGLVKGQALAIDLESEAPDPISAATLYWQVLINGQAINPSALSLEPN